MKAPTKMGKRAMRIRLAYAVSIPSTVDLGFAALEPLARRSPSGRVSLTCARKEERSWRRGEGDN